MKDLKGTRTGEPQVRLPESLRPATSTFFASRARKDGYVQIAKVFEETAGNERSMRALVRFRGHRHHIRISYRRRENTRNGPNVQEFAQVAREEGFTELAARFDRVAAIEKTHEALPRWPGT